MYQPLRSVFSRTCNVHVWRICLQRDASQELKLYNILSVDERLRSSRYRFNIDHHRFVIARGVVRIILGGYLGVAPSKVRFSYNRYGKPSLDHGSNAVRFNVAHSRDLAYLAVTKSSEVGIDLEFIDRDFAISKAAKHVFSSREYFQLQTAMQDEQVDLFFRFWTRKEAILKAAGDGFAGTTEEIGRKGKWTVKNMSLDRGFEAALAVEGEIDNIFFRAEEPQI